MSVKNLILSKSNQYTYYKEQYDKLKKENEKLEDKIKKSKDNNHEKGISAIIPSYKGEKHIKTLLDSLEKQTLNPELYELIFIVNGEMDSTMEIIKEFIIENPEKEIILSYTSKSGVSNARNVGLRLSKKEYTTFIDDDDFISPNFLEKMLEHSKPDRVVMSNFIDIDEDTNEEVESYLVPFSVTDHGTIDGAPIKFFALSAITQAKSIPTYATKSTEFNQDLPSGVDIAYYGHLYPKFDFEFYFIDKKEEVIYYRLRRSESVSRQKMSYQFNVIDRLKVIDDLNDAYNKTNDEKYKKFIEKGIKGQSGFIKRYLEKNSDDKDKVMKEIEKYNFTHFPYHLLENI